MWPIVENHSTVPSTVNGFRPKRLFVSTRHTPLTKATNTHVRPNIIPKPYSVTVFSPIVTTYMSTLATSTMSKTDTILLTPDVLTS